MTWSELEESPVLPEFPSDLLNVERALQSA